MIFTLARFDEGDGLRRFQFERVVVGSARTTVVVHADVSLARKHEIRLQELPLICARLLDSFGADMPAGPVTLTEEKMIAIQSATREAAEKRRKPPRRPHREPGRAWPEPHA